MNDKEIFEEVFEFMRSEYKGLEMCGTLVFYNGEAKFNTDGFCALYNITRLCEVLKKELL